METTSSHLADIGNAKSPADQTVRGRNREGELHLRSCAVSASFSGVRALLSNVSSSSISTCSSGSALAVSAGLGILHDLVRVIVVAVIVVVSHQRELPGHIYLFTLEELVDDFANLAVARAYPSRVPAAALRLRLQPEEVSLGGRRELEHEYATVRFGARLSGRFCVIRHEVPIGRNHNEIERRLVQRDISRSPAEVNQICQESGLAFSRCGGTAKPRTHRLPSEGRRNRALAPVSPCTALKIADARFSRASSTVGMDLCTYIHVTEAGLEGDDGRDRHDEGASNSDRS